TIHVTFTEEPLANVLAAFADYANTSIIAEADVKGRLITAEVRDQPWDLALDAILAANGLFATANEAGVIIVKDASRRIQRQVKVRPATRQFPIRYVNAGSLIRPVAGMVSERGRVVANTTTNTLVVTDAASVLDRIAPLVEQLDARAPQVNISATIAF